MIDRRLIFLPFAAASIVAVSYFFIGEPALLSRTSIPLRDTQPAFGILSGEQLVRFWQDRSERHPKDYISLTYLGHSHLLLARENGDIGAFERAQAALDVALAINPDYEPSLAFLGAARLSQHDFRGALALAERVYAFDPGALQALATIGDAHMELGNYTQARHAYLQLAERELSPPIRSRLARLAWIEGRPVEALEHMQLAASEARDSGQSNESVAWYEFQVGDLFLDSGRLNPAERHFEQALELFPDYYLALAGLAELRMMQDRLTEAIDLYARVTESANNPGFHSQLGYLYELRGDADLAQEQYDAAIATSTQYPALYSRELSMFYSDTEIHLHQALEIARSQLAIRQDIYTWDTLAWALFKNGRYDEAAEAMERALAMGTQDASLFYHAGMVLAAIGDQRGAIEMLSAALAINPNFDLFYSPTAQGTLAHLRSN